MVRYILLSVLAATGVFAQSADDGQLLNEAAAIDRQFEQRGLVYHDAAIEKRLADLATPMLPATSAAYVHWHFRILREPLINAFALPNGSVYVNSGLIAMAENDDQLAGVLAHEITHVTKSHTFQFARKYRKRVITSEVIGSVLFWTPLSGAASVTAFIIANLSEVTLVVTLLGYSRELEREADKAAVELMQTAHRDAAQFARSFELFDERLDPEPVATFWRTHPKNQERVKHVHEMVDGRTVEHPAADPHYLAAMRPVILLNIQLDLESRRYRTAINRAQRLVDANPSDPESLYWLGEAYRDLGPRTVLPSEKERTDDGQNEAHRKAVKRTAEEEARALAATPEGKAALEANQAKAAECFAKTGDYPKKHLGLGALYEQQDRKAEALSEYRKYLEVSPQAADRVRVERRMESLAAK